MIGLPQQRRPKALLDGTTRDRKFPGSQSGAVWEFLETRNCTNVLGTTTSSSGRWNHGNLKDAIHKWEAQYGSVEHSVSPWRLIQLKMEMAEAFPQASKSRSGVDDYRRGTQDLTNALAASLAVYREQAVVIGEVLEHKKNKAMLPAVSEALTNAAKEIDFILVELGRPGNDGLGTLPPHLIDGLLEAFVEDDASGISGPAAELHRSICAMIRDLRPPKQRLVRSDVLDHLQAELGGYVRGSEATAELPALSNSQPRPGSSVRAFRAMQELNASGMPNELARESVANHQLTPPANVGEESSQAAKSSSKIKSHARAQVQMKSQGKSSGQSASASLARFTPPQDISQPFAVKVEFPALPPWWAIYFMPRRAATGPWKKEVQDNQYPKAIKSGFQGCQSTETPAGRTLPTGWKNKNSLAAASAKAMQRKVSEAMLASAPPPMPDKQSLSISEPSESGMGQIDLLLDQLHQETLNRSASKAFITTAAEE